MGVYNLREELNELASRQVTVVTANSGPGACTITAVVVAGVIGYAYIKWKGWKLSDMMFVTKRGLSDACNVVGSQLDQVSDTVVVTKKDLTRKIDRVDISLDETQQIIEGTRDEVAVIHVDLSTFQEDLQSVNLVVQTLESKLGRLESSQDQTVDGINHLCVIIHSPKHRIFFRANCEGMDLRYVPALEDISLVAESPRAESPKVSPAAESSRAEALQDQKGSRTCSTNREGSSHVMASSNQASMNTPNPTSSSRFGGLRLPLPGLSFLRASSALS
nr:unnamed protein product [Digitaria exilis]